MACSVSRDRRVATEVSRVERPRGGGGGGALPADDAQTYNTRVQSKVRSLANLAAASATCQPAAAARRSQARRALGGVFPAEIGARGFDE